MTAIRDELAQAAREPKVPESDTDVSLSLAPVPGVVDLSLWLEDDE